MRHNVHKKKNRNGFTLIELIVVVSITAMLSSFAILYSKIGQRQITLYIEQQKIAELILRAKSLSFSTYFQPGRTCGYGLHIDYGLRRYSIFSYLPPGPVGNPQCDTIAAAQILPSNVQTFSDLNTLDTNLAFRSPSPADALSYVLFVPPNPTTILSANPGGILSVNPAKIYLQTKDGGGAVVITVSQAGQVDF